MFVTFGPEEVLIYALPPRSANTHRVIRIRISTWFTQTHRWTIWKHWRLVPFLTRTSRSLFVPQEAPSPWPVTFMTERRVYSAQQRHLHDARQARDSCWEFNSDQRNTDGLEVKCSGSTGQVTPYEYLTLTLSVPLLCKTIPMAKRAFPVSSNNFSSSIFPSSFSSLNFSTNLDFKIVFLLSQITSWFPDLRGERHKFQNYFWFNYK